MFLFREEYHAMETKPQWKTQSWLKPESLKRSMGDDGSLAANINLVGNILENSWFQFMSK